MYARTRTYTKCTANQKPRLCKQQRCTYMPRVDVRVVVVYGVSTRLLQVFSARAENARTATGRKMKFIYYADSYC